MRKRDPQPWLVDDDLWARIEPLIPKQQRRRGPGRRPVDDRRVLCGILFVLYTGIRWEWLPGELGFGCGMTCWSASAGLEQCRCLATPARTLLAELRAADKLDLSRAVVDSSHIRALKGGPKPVGVR